jgi:hypothetical protein
MDEEDGRPGALAAQAGQPDALKDALTLSLRLNNSSKPTVRIDSPRIAGPARGPTGEKHRLGRSPQFEPHSNHNYKGRWKLARPQVEEKHHENVPGK